VHNGLANPPEFALPGHDEQGRVEERMVLAEILLALVAPHFGLLPFRLQQFDVEVLRPP